MNKIRMSLNLASHDEYSMSYRNHKNQPLKTGRNQNLEQKFDEQELNEGLLEFVQWILCEL